MSVLDLSNILPTGSNFHKIFDQWVQVLQFLFICHLSSRQKQSHWFKEFVKIQDL